jgi:hypothetical protein
MGKKTLKKKGKAMTSEDLEDFGTFTIGHPDEQSIVGRLWELAAKNEKFPGTAHIRMLATRPETGKEAGKKTYSLDLNLGRLVVVEEHDGKVRARKTIPIQTTVPEPDDRPPALVPGPAEASFAREPFVAADLNIDDELRDWAMAAIDEMLPGLAAVPACIGLFRERQQDAFSPAEPLLPANVPRLGATLALLRRRPNHERVLVEGWVEAGETTGLAFVLEAIGEDAWWLGVRPFRRRAGPIGEWSGQWQQIDSGGPAPIPLPLRALRWPLAGATAYDTGEPAIAETPENEVAFGEFAAGVVLPATAEGFATVSAGPFEQDVQANKGEHPPRLMVFRGRHWERWSLDGPLPTDMDDMVRNICARGELPEAVVLIRFGLVPLDGGGLTKCLLSVAEHKGERYTRAMEIRADATGKVAGVRYLRAGREDDERWIGVEPITKLTTTERPGEAES